MAGEWPTQRVVDVADVTDYVANGSFESLRNNVTYRDKPDYAVLVRLVDHNADWKGDFVYVDKASFDFLKKSSLVPGDIVIANVGANAGTVFRVPDLGQPMTLGPNAILCKPKNEDHLARRYLYYYLISAEGQASLASIRSGSAQPKFNKTDFRSLSVPVPPPPEQRAIAHILGTLDDKIELNRRMNETLEAIARAIFKSWFVDFDPVRAKAGGEAPESICSRLGLTSEILALFPDRLVDSELGEIPEGWGVRGLDSIALLSTKSISPGKEPLEIFEHYSIPAFDAGSRPVYDLGGTIKSNKYVVSPSAVLVSKLNPETPRVWLPTVKTDRAVCSTEFMQFVPTRNCGRSYLYLLMCSDPMQVEILKRVTGSTGSRQRAQPSQIATLPIVVPAEEVIRAFEPLVLPLLTDAGRNLAQSETLASLRDALLPKLLSGELCVPAAAEVA